jgi:hypothetical protein
MTDMGTLALTTSVDSRYGGVQKVEVSPDNDKLPPDFKLPDIAMFDTGRWGLNEVAEDHLWRMDNNEFFLGRAACMFEMDQAVALALEALPVATGWRQNSLPV